MAMLLKSWLICAYDSLNSDELWRSHYYLDALLKSSYCNYGSQITFSIVAILHGMKKEHEKEHEKAATSSEY